MHKIQPVGSETTIRFQTLTSSRNGSFSFAFLSRLKDLFCLAVGFQGYVQENAVLHQQLALGKEKL